MNTFTTVFLLILLLGCCEFSEGLICWECHSNKYKNTCDHPVKKTCNQGENACFSSTYRSTKWGEVFSKYCDHKDDGCIPGDKCEGCQTDLCNTKTLQELKNQ